MSDRIYKTDNGDWYMNDSSSGETHRIFPDESNSEFSSFDSDDDNDTDYQSSSDFVSEWDDNF